MNDGYIPTGAALVTGDCDRPAPVPDVNVASVAAEQAPPPVQSAVIRPVTCGFAGCPLLLVEACDGNRGPFYKHQRNAHDGQGLRWLAHVQALPGCPRNLMVAAASGSGFATCSTCQNLVATNGCAPCKKLDLGARNVRITQSMLDDAAATAVVPPSALFTPQPTTRGHAQGSLSQFGGGSQHSPPLSGPGEGQQSQHVPSDDENAADSDVEEQRPLQYPPGDEHDSGSDREEQQPQLQTSGADDVSGSDHDDNAEQGTPDGGAALEQWTSLHPSIRRLLNYKECVRHSVIATVLSMSPTHAGIMAQMFIRLYALQEQCVASDDDVGLDAVTVLQHLLPGLLLSPDVSVPRNERFARVMELDLDDLVKKLVFYTVAAPSPVPTAHTEEQLRRLATRTAKSPNGMSRAAELLAGTELQSPRNRDTADKLQAKYPQQSATEPELEEAMENSIAAAKAAMAAVSPEEQMQYSADEWEGAIRYIIMKKRLTSASGPDGLRFGHLQLMIATGYGGELLRRMAFWPALFFSDQCSRMTPFYWRAHTLSVLSALGEKCRPVSCGNAFRRAIGAAMARLSKDVLARRFKKRGQLAWERAGTEQHAFKAQTQHEAGRWVLATDLTNAYNTMSTMAILSPTGQ